ncbi:hypothetical protein WJX81_001015 [Elliptochloris bilobata]|uniref:Magnesium transporter n=1 Tax=Elliptochloris bilobata TaxID=381761 RepID=A0AAW1QHM8_9CHLO
MHHTDSGMFDVAYEPLAGASGTEDERAEEGRGWWKPAGQSHLAPPSGQTSGAASPTGSGAVGRSRQTSPRSSKKAVKAAGAPRESRARRASWLVLTRAAVKTFFVSDKRGVIQKFKLGVPIRDMRLLDPNLLTSETGKVLVRDNAIVFSMEHARLIITADCVIIPQSGFDHSPLAQHFSTLLEEHITEAAQEAQARDFAAGQAAERIQDAVELDDVSDDSSGFRHEVMPLPFELQMLEVALGAVCALCSQLVKELEAVAHPALDALTKHVTTGNLERVRKVKTRHQRLWTRVVTVREELQRFLEDDDDMMKMCLTRKKLLEHANASVGLTSAPSFANNARRSGSMSLGSLPRFSGWPPATPASPRGPAGAPAGDGGGAGDNDSEESIEAVENLLESYFMQIDASYDRLVSIGEYIKDTEEYINIELDSSRNRLIRLEIIITSATFGVAMFSLVAGILGENLVLPARITKGVHSFWLINIVTFSLCLVFFMGLMLYIRWRRLM